MGIKKNIYDWVAGREKDFTIKDVRIGLGYIAVLLDDGQCGVAYSFLPEKKKGCTLFNGEMPLHGKPVKEVIPLILSNQEIESAVGLAAVNAITNRKDGSLMKGDILETLNIRSSDQVGMVGHFRPLASPIAKQADNLYIFEQIEKKMGNILPANDMGKILPDCDIAVITSTSIINDTLDAVLKHCQNCREVLLLGPSTPLISDIISETPVTMLSGVIVTHPADILNIVSCGGGMKRFKNYVQKVNLVRNRDV